MAACGELVLLLAGHGSLAVVGRLGQATHALRGEHVGEGVVVHVVAQRDVAVLEPVAALLEQVRRVGHRLLAAGDDDLELTCADELVGERDGVDAGEADLVDAQRRDVHGDAGLDGCLPCGDLPLTGVEDLAHDHVVDVLRVDARLVEGALDGEAAEVGAAEALERAAHPTHGGASAGDDDGGVCRHAKSSSLISHAGMPSTLAPRAGPVRGPPR